MRNLILLFLVCLLIVVPASSGAAGDIQQITRSEEQEARDLATRFITEFAEARDLTPVVEHLYARDFIQRFNQSKVKHPEMSLDLYFMPGLEYERALLSQGTVDDWKSFYVAQNTFLFLGVVSGFKKSPTKAEDLGPTDLYPPRVIELLNQNPNLKNVIVRKEPGKPIASVEELRKATATLKQAATMMREDPPAKLDQKELVNALKDEFFKPELETSLGEEFFGLPKNSRVILMKTPILFFLMLTRENGQLKILYAIPYAGD